jgi:hypothetical protein
VSSVAGDGEAGAFRLGFRGIVWKKTVAAVAASPASPVEKWAWAFNGGPGLVSAQLETNKRSVSSSVLG